MDGVFLGAAVRSGRWFAGGSLGEVKESLAVPRAGTPVPTLLRLGMFLESLL